MRLVGATNWFIRWPFMVEGLVCGLLGAAIAIGFLFLGKTVIVDPLANNFNLINSGDTIGFANLALVLLCVAMAVSAMGSGMTLRRFLAGFEPSTYRRRGRRGGVRGGHRRRRAGGRDPRRRRRRLRQPEPGRHLRGDRRDQRRLLPRRRRQGPGERVDHLHHRPPQGALSRPLLPLLHLLRVRPLQTGLPSLRGGGQGERGPSWAAGRDRLQAHASSGGRDQARRGDHGCERRSDRGRGRRCRHLQDQGSGRDQGDADHRKQRWEEPPSHPHSEGG